MTVKFTRRKFLQTTTCAAAAFSFAGLSGAGNSFVQQAQAASGSYSTTETVTGGICGMCFWRCQLVGKVRDGKLVKLEGNPKSIDNGTSLCARGNAGIKLLYDPDRLKYPLKNVGERGAPKWKRISWDEALDECAAKLKAAIDDTGPHSIAVFPHGSSARYPANFFQNVVGTPNTTESSFFQCRGDRDMAYLKTLGVPAGEEVDMPNAKAIFLVGSHLGENVHVSHLKRYLKGLENGARLIVVDPRFSAAAAKADIWVKIKPGTDTAFLLAMMNYLIRQGKYAKDYVEEHGVGFEEFVEGIAHASTAWAARICDVPEGQIIEVAELLAALAPHVAIHPGRHTSWYGTDFQRERAMACFTGLLGAIGVAGGFVRPVLPKVGNVNWPRLMAEHVWDHSLHRMSDIHPFSPPGTPTDLIRQAAISGEPYPIKACITWGANPIQTVPNQELTIRMLKAMDFVLVCDIMPTDITMFADILLPEVSYLERYDHVQRGTQWDFAEPHQQFIAPRMPLVSPVSGDHERRDSVWITNELAKRMGYGEHIPVSSAEEMVDLVLSGAEPPLSLAQLRKEDGIHVRPGVDPYGVDLEVNFFLEDIEDWDFSPVPAYLPIPDPPKGFARLVYGRLPAHTFNRTQNNSWLHNESPINPVWLNDESAGAMGLKAGDLVEMVNQDGVKSRTGTVVLVTPGIRKDTVYMAHGYGSMNPEMRVGVGAGIDDTSLITTLAINPETGTHGLRKDFVRFIKDGRTLNIPG